MKRKEIIILGAVLGGLLASVSAVVNSLDLRLDKLEESIQIGEQRPKVEQMEEETRTQVIIECDNAEFMQLIFPTDGNYYVEATGIVTFYSDPKCENEISTPRFLSGETHVKYYNLLTDGYDMEIYCLLMENGKICYCPGHKRPVLITEAQYEYYKETKTE